jgi:hypothetical protein
MVSFKRDIFGPMILFFCLNYISTADSSATSTATTDTTSSQSSTSTGSTNTETTTTTQKNSDKFICDPQYASGLKTVSFMNYT